MTAKKILERAGCDGEFASYLLISLGEIEPETWAQALSVWEQTRVDTPERKEMFAKVKAMSDTLGRATFVWKHTKAGSPEWAEMFVHIRAMIGTLKSATWVWKHTKAGSPERKEIFAEARKMAKRLLADV